MRRKSVLSVVCLLVFAMLCGSFTCTAYADTDNTGAVSTGEEISSGTDTEDTDTSAQESSDDSTNTGGTVTPPEDESKYTVTLLDTNTTFNMTEQNGVYTYTATLVGDSLYGFSINREGNAIGGVTYLLYKSSDGKVSFTYSSIDGVELVCESGDVYDKFDFEKNIYCVSVEGGYFDELVGKFKGKKLTEFYFPAGEAISIAANTVDDDKEFDTWSTSSTAVNFESKTNEKTEITISGVKKNITVKANFKNKVFSLEELIKDIKDITLEQSYTTTNTIKLTSGEYVIDLGGYDIVSSDTVFEVAGATLTIEGEGSIQSTKSSGYGILLSSGSLIIKGGDISGQISGIEAKGGNLEISGGSVFGKTSAAARFYSSCEAIISGGNFSGSVTTQTSVSISGGNITVNGGTFKGTKTVAKYGTSGELKIYAGTFEADVTDFLADGSSIEQAANGMYIVTVDQAKYSVTVFGGKGGGMYKAGQTVTLTANADEDISSFDGWSVVSGELQLSNTSSRTISFTMPEFDVVLKANFVITDTVEAGQIGSDTLPPEATATETQPNTNDSMETDLDSVNSPLAPAETTGVSGSSAGGSFAIIVIIIILVALLVAAIAVSAILIVRKYKIEKAAAERAELGDSLVDDLADQLSELDFGDAEKDAAAGAAAGAVELGDNDVKLRAVKKVSEPKHSQQDADDLAQTREMKKDAEHHQE